MNTAIQSTYSETIVIAGDHAGFELKETLKKAFPGMEDLGTHDAQSVDYPDYAHKLAGWMEKHPASKGILICGSGIGMSIAANRHKHVRAALVQTPEAAALARQHNDANVLCLGARLIDAKTAAECVQQFLNTEFEGGRHQTRVEKL